MLTEAGRALVPHAEDLLARAVDAESEIAQIAHRAQPVVRLGAFATAGATVVADAIASIRQTHPDIELTLIEGDCIVPEVKTGNVDVAVVFDDIAHPIGEVEGMQLVLLYQDPLLLAMPRGHPLAHREVVNLADLRDEAWIEGAGDETPCSLILAAACEEVGFEPRIAFNSGNYQVVLRLVATGVGVALVPGLAIVSADPDVVIRAVGPRNPFRRVGLAVREVRRRSAALNVVVDALTSTFEAYAARQGASASASALQTPASAFQ